MNDQPKFLHRDDLPMDVVAEIEKRLSEEVPGIKVIFAGDHENNLSPELLEAAKAFEREHERLFCEGRCLDCQVQMDNWSDVDKEEWQPPAGWRHFKNGDGEDADICGWQCPACDAKGTYEQQQPPRT